MSYYPDYTPGDWKCECMVCGRIFKGSKIRKRWDGLLVCPDDWEQKHDQLSVTGVRDSQWVPFTLKEAGESASPANFEVSQDKNIGKTFNTEIERVGTLPTSPEAGDRIFYDVVGAILLSDGTNWYYANGMPLPGRVTVDQDVTSGNIHYSGETPVNYKFYLTRVPVIQDNFNRADESPIASPWIQINPNPAAYLFMNSYYGDGFGSDAVYYDSADTFDSNQYSQIKITEYTEQVGYDVTDVFLHLNRSNANTIDANYYNLAFRKEGWIADSGYTQCSIDKVYLGNTTSLAGGSPSISNAILNQNIIGQRYDSTLKLILGNMTTIEATDSEITGGKPAYLHTFSYFQPASNYTLYDDFECGNVVGSIA